MGTGGGTRNGLKTATRIARRLMVPRLPQALGYSDGVDGAFDDAIYEMPPPFFITTISLVQIGVFAYYVTTNGYNALLPFHSPFIYDPTRRYEAWRNISYMFVHSSYTHIILNIFIQFVLGNALELVHKFGRVAILYVCGVIAGSLLTSIINPSTFLGGASAGVYALITAHFSTIVMNYDEMEFAPLQLLAAIVLLVSVYIQAICQFYFIPSGNTSVGFAAHLGGGIAGLLTGVFVLRTFEKNPLKTSLCVPRSKGWRYVLWWTSIVGFTVWMLSMVIWNLAFPSYFLNPS